MNDARSNHDHRGSRRESRRRSRQGAGPGRRGRGCRRRHRQVPDLQRRFAGGRDRRRRPTIRQRTTGGGESQRAMLRRLELPHDAHRTLLAHAKRRGIEFLSTPFDPDVAASPAVARSAADQDRLRRPDQCAAAACSSRKSDRDADPVDRHGDARRGRGSARRARLGYSRSATSRPASPAFRAAWARSGSAQAVCAGASACCTARPNIPARPQDVNLARHGDDAQRVRAVRSAIPTTPTASKSSLAAVALGATIIEKHLTLDRNAAGPDHAASLEPDQISSDGASDPQHREGDRRRHQGAATVRDREHADRAQEPGGGACRSRPATSRGRRHREQAPRAPAARRSNTGRLSARRRRASMTDEEPL